MNKIRISIGIILFIPLLVIILKMSGCGRIDNRFNVTNATNKTLYYHLSFDSSGTDFFNEIQKIQNGSNNDTAPIKTYFTQLEPKIDTITEILHGKWETYMSTNHIESLWIFILNDSLSNHRINSLSELKNTIQSRKSYDIGYLKKNKWLIVIKE